jgi:hypothetical protein
VFRVLRFAEREIFNAIEGVALRGLTSQKLARVASARVLASGASTRSHRKLLACDGRLDLDNCGKSSIASS